MRWTRPEIPCLVQSVGRRESRVIAQPVSNPLTLPASRRVGRSLFGLQTKYTVIAAGMALIVGASAATAVLRLTTGLIRRLHNQHCTQMANLLANRAATALDRSPTDLQRFVTDMAAGEPIVFLSVMDTSGRALASAASPRGGVHVTEGLTPDTIIGAPVMVSATDQHGAYLDVTHPITRVNSVTASGEQRISLLGYVRAGFSLERTLAEVNAAMSFLSGIAVVVVALAVPLSYLLIRIMIRPLHSLANTMTRFADGDLEARSAIRRNDEIGLLALAYNHLADRHSAKVQEISQLNSELEERVQQRTKQLRELASRDALTGLYNRRHFDEVLERRVAEANRYGHELACIMIDLDDFKAVNDRFGHQTGDELLVLTAIVITTQLRTADLAARFGGDEFIILLPQTGMDSGRVLAERIRQAFRAAVAEQFPRSQVSISLGLGCMADIVTKDPYDLVRVADKALYDAKNVGKDTVASRHVGV